MGKGISKISIVAKPKTKIIKGHEKCIWSCMAEKPCLLEKNITAAFIVTQLSQKSRQPRACGLIVKMFFRAWISNAHLLLKQKTAPIP